MARKQLLKTRAKPAQRTGARRVTKPTNPANLQRVNVTLRVKSTTRDLLKRVGFDWYTGRAATPGAQAARVLDEWAKLTTEARQKDIEEPNWVKVVEKVGVRRKGWQLGAWVLPATATLLYVASISKPHELRSLSHNAGLIVDMWADRLAGVTSQDATAQSETTV